MPPDVPRWLCLADQQLDSLRLRRPTCRAGSASRITCYKRYGYAARCAALALPRGSLAINVTATPPDVPGSASRASCYKNSGYAARSLLSQYVRVVSWPLYLTPHFREAPHALQTHQRLTSPLHHSSN